jgi:L-ascorbate metabolism protein UlaG (beta-lactamase superfamily)
MKLTKYEHACFTVEHDDALLVIDPGNLTTDLIPPQNVVGVVITHGHADHFDPELLASIIDKNPDALIVTNVEVASSIEAFQTKIVHPGDHLELGPFRLQFFGGQHARIHDSIPPNANIAVLINDLVYYPGDSFTLPGTSVDTLAIPVSAPWMKLSEAIDFLSIIKPRQAFPTHDAILSNPGKDIADRLLSSAAQSQGIAYTRLTESIEI